jgi:ABC-type nickel/cobalt efflux system permease component RcnA
MQHAFEADHVAAVSSIVSRRQGVAKISMHGVAWGLGHTLTLALVAGTCLFLKTSLDEAIAEKLELCVGVMLVGLGLHVLYRLWRDRVHIDAHKHADGIVHLHAHSHRDDHAPHARSAHQHEHPNSLPWRTLLVGTMHGMAGSAALVVLAASQITTVWGGITYIFLFGIGSVAGMALLSAVIALPLTYTAKSLTAGNRALQGVIGTVTIALGLRIVHEAGGAVFGWV